MKRIEYEQRSRALEETFEAEIATVRAAQQIRRRAFEALCLADLEDEPAEAPAAPSTSPPPSLDTVTAIEQVLPRLPEVFDKNDVLRILGWAPPRATLFRVLQSFVLEGRLVVDRYGSGRTSTTYRKRTITDAAATTEDSSTPAASAGEDRPPRVPGSGE